MNYSQETREHIESRTATTTAPVLMPYFCVRKVAKKSRKRLYSDGAINLIGGVCSVGLLVLALLGGMIAWGP